MSQPKPLLFKNELLIYTQKQHLPEPEYEIVKEGPDHKAIFTATVIVDGQRYGSPPSSCSSNRKAAEHAAARVALEKLCNKEGNYPSEVFNSGLCKSLLQERLKKLNLPDPYYSCEESRDGPETTYEASVEIAGTKYVGGSAKSKKLATMKAARTALLAIQGQHCKSDVSSGNYPSAMLDSGIYRNLLQDQMRKLKLPDPYYIWEVSGEGPKYTYKATVKITGTLYVGGPARSKKVAAAKAARAALSAIQGQQCMSNTEHVEAHSGMKRGREVEHPSEGQKDEMNKRWTTENASAIKVEDKQSHLQQDMPVYDGQEIKPVAEHNFQDNGQKSEVVEMVQRTEEQAKQSTGNVEIKSVAELNSQEIGLKSEGVEMVQRTEEQAKQSTGVTQPNLSLFKNHLREYTQKLHIPTPVYKIVKKGPEHEPNFTATVTVNGKLYASPPSSCFRNHRAAEHAAARVALQELSEEEGNASAVNSPNAVLDTEFCRTLLHEQLKKLNLSDPSYSWEKSGEGPKSTYEGTVEIAGTHYVGGPAKSKKGAVIKAARTALLAIQGQHCKSTTEVVVDAHSGFKREREVEQPAEGQKDEMNKKRNTESASAIDLKDEQSHLQREMCVNDGQETKAGEGLSYQETAQKSEGEEMVHRSEEEAKESRDEVVPALEEIDGQLTKPVAGLNYQDTSQKREGVEMVHRTEKEAKESRGEEAKESRDEVVPAVEEIDGQLTKPVAVLNNQETAQKSEGEEMMHRTDEQAKQSSDEVVPALEKVIPKM